jgi:outer membrane beta-barrel protein
MRKPIVALLLSVVVAAPAFAESRNMLDGQASVRHRRELRSGRLELGPMLGFTFLEPYRHTLVGGVKANYHLSDWLSIGAVGVFGVVNLKTGLTNEIADSEQALINSEDCGGDEECGGIPDEDGVDWQDAQNSLKFAASIRATVTPLAGKLALFKSVFAPFDLYFFGGLGVLGFKNDAGGTSAMCGNQACDGDLGNDGISMGPNFGVGWHLFFNDVVALNFEFTDTLAGNNASGRNINESSGNNVVDGDDKRFGHNMMMLLGASFYFPTDAARSK